MPIIIVKTLGLKTGFSRDKSKQVGQSKKPEMRIVLALHTWPDDQDLHHRWKLSLTECDKKGASL